VVECLEAMLEEMRTTNEHLQEICGRFDNVENSCVADAISKAVDDIKAGCSLGDLYSSLRDIDMNTSA
jgi:hypothetical protein